MNQQEIDFTFYDKINDTFDLNGRMGITDYIDFLTQKEVPKNVMKGVDCYGRKFITMKIGGIDLDNMKFFRSAQVFFERYTDSPYLAGADFEGSFILISGGVNRSQYQLINDLVNNKVIQIKDEHRFNSCKFNCIIANMDYWEEKAARIIQKFWRHCYYHPKHTVRINIINRQFDEYKNYLDNI